MNWEKLKNNKALQIGLIIAVPTAIVLGYYGYKYIKKRREESGSRLKLNTDGSVDTTGMDYYKITTPFSPEIASKIYESIVNTGHYYIGDIVIDDKDKQTLIIEIMTKPEEVEKIRNTLIKVRNDIKIEKITKEQSVILPKKVQCDKKSEEVNNINDFYEHAKCLEQTKLFGYDLLPLKDLPNIEKRVSIDELKSILSYAEKGITKLNDDEAKDFMKLMVKAYTRI